MACTNTDTYLFLSRGVAYFTLVLASRKWTWHFILFSPPCHYILPVIPNAIVIAT